MDEPSDGQLLTAWSGGDAGAFEALVQRHQGALLRHARALLGERRGSEDVVQEVFLRLAQRPPDLSGAKDGAAEERRVLSAWLHRVTRNLCMDTQRSEGRRKRREEEVAPDEATGGGQGEVDANDTREAVELGLSRLPEEQREVLVLRLLGNQSYKEIAEITGRRIGTIGWMISVGMKALASELAPLLGQDPSSSLARTNPQVESLHGEVS